MGSHREIWIGSDCSGLIRETSGPVSFFTADGEARWRAAGSPDLCRAVYEIARRLDHVEELGETRDQLGRAGLGLARVEHGDRVEAIFDRDASELLAYQRFLADPSHGYAPVGTLVSWTAYIRRELVDSLPAGTPPVPGPPCSPPGSGRGTVIERGFFLGTGYFEDLEPQLEEWLARGVITDAQHHAVRDRDLPDS